MQRLGEDHAVTRMVRARLRPRRRARRVVRVLERPPSLWRWVPFMLLVVGGVTLLQFGAAGMDQLVGTQVGEPCTVNESCGPDELCTTELPPSERYCTRRCAEERDCPAGMHCGGRVCLSNRQ